MDTLHLASEWFWNPDFWLPVNFTWEDIQPTEEFSYPNNKDIYTYPIVLSIVLIVTNRRLLIPVFFLPLAKYYGLNCARSSPPKKIPALEAIYREFNRHVPKFQKQREAERLKWKLKDVDKWFYRRVASTKTPVGDKFAETCCNGMWHFVGFLYGFVALYDKIWVNDINHCWEGYPYHEIDPDIWGYYVYMLGFFWSLAISQLLQPSNAKDQWAVYIHHLFCILLLCFSWTLNLVRPGSLILALHGVSDWLLIVGKLANYVQNELITNIFFGLAIISWIITRLIIFPLWIMRSAFFVGPTYMFMPSAYLFYFMLMCLLLLNVMWMGMMLLIVVRKLKSGKLEDLRSSDPTSCDETEDEQ